MSGVQFRWLRTFVFSTPGKIAAIAVVVCFAGLVGFCLPSELREYVPALRFIDGALTILFGVLSWECFQLVVPARNFYFRKWTDSAVLAGKFGGAGGFAADPTSPDAGWIQARSTVLK